MRQVGYLQRWLRILEKRVMRNTFEPMKEEIILLGRSRRVRLLRHAACIGQRNNACKHFVGNMKK